MLCAVGFWAIVREDYRQNKRSLVKPGFQALFAHRLAVYATIVRHPMRLALKAVARLGQLFCRNFYGIEMSTSVNIGRRLELGHQHGIVIHRHATIGDDCIIRQNVTFGVGVEWTPGRGPTIGNRVHFGVGSVVVGNVTIGDDVMIGPNCVIIRNVPPNSSLFMPPPRMIQRTAPSGALEQAGKSDVEGSSEVSDQKTG